MENKNLAAVEAESTLAAPEEHAKKPGLMRGARDFIENTLGSLKGKEIYDSCRSDLIILEIEGYTSC